MKQSIETIWKEGFIQDKALVIPKVTDLYNQKSQNIVDKLHQMFEINLKAIVGGALMFLAASFFWGIPWFGLWLTLMLGALVGLGRKELKSLARVDKSVNSYEYLKSFEIWMKDMIAHYTRLYRYFYPLVFIGAAIQFRFSDAMDEILKLWLNKAPDTFLLAGTPIALWVAAGIVTFLVTYFAGTIYRWDFNLVYGNAMKKLEELIADMEELRR